MSHKWSEKDMNVIVQPTLTETESEWDLNLHDLRRIKETKPFVTLILISGCHSKMSNPSISQRNFQTDESKSTNVSMRITIDNVTQVVRMKF